MSRFVVDCSVSLSWCFPDESNSYAKRVLDSLEDNQAVTPAIWALEFLNGLIVAERRQRITQADTATYVSEISLMRIETDAGMIRETQAGLLAIARDHGLSVYDASYLELALRLGLPIATLDERLRNAANAAGVGVFEP